MQQNREHRPLQEERERQLSQFNEKFQKWLECGPLSPMSKYQPAPLRRMRECCWDFRRFAARSEIKGARARRALSLLLRLKNELGEAMWLSEGVASAVDTLEEDLRNLASSRARGRRRDGLGQTFRRNIGIFLRPAALTKQGCRALSREETDEVLSDLFRVALGRAVSPKSHARMRKREKAAEKREMH